MRHSLIVPLSLTLCVLFFATDALAWGPRSRKAIAASAITLLRRNYDDAFKAGQTAYDMDVLRGAEEGVPAIEGEVPLNTDAQAISAVSQQIEILRAVRKDGTGSYFAYRMGVLGALASEVVFPYGVPFTPEATRLAQILDEEIDAHVDQLTFAVSHTGVGPIRDVQRYFQGKRTFYPDDLGIIRDDYATGRGYNGFLSEADQTYFSRAIEATADAWFSVFTAQGNPYAAGDVSPRILADYYLDEIRYLLLVRKNFEQAVRAYENLEKVNPGEPVLFETAGDYFYEFGQNAYGLATANVSAIDRGVREWQRAYGTPGAHRDRVSKKLSTHFIGQGDRLFRRADAPGGTSTDLEEALQNFRKALEFDRGNDLAADRINETTVAIRAKRERFNMQQTVIDRSRTLVAQAEQNRLEEQYSNAIRTYQQAQNVLSVVDNEFPELETLATSTVNEINKATQDIIDEVMKRARTYVDEGDVARDNNQFENALNSYMLVEPTVNIIPDDRSATITQRKEELALLAEQRITDTKSAMQAFQDQQNAPPAPRQ